MFIRTILLACAAMLAATLIGHGEIHAENTPASLSLIVPGSIPAEPVQVIKLLLDGDASSVPFTQPAAPATSH